MSEDQTTGSGDAISMLAPLTFDAERYRSYVEDFDLDDRQKHALLEAVWCIVVSFADVGFGGHPIQHALGANLRNSLTRESSPVVSSGEVSPKTPNDKSRNAPRRGTTEEDSR